MNSLRKKPVLRKTVATGLITLGFVGLAIPLIPGWPLIGVGFFLLSVDSPKIQGYVGRIRAKSSALDTVLVHSYDRMHAKYPPIQDIQEIQKL